MPEGDAVTVDGEARAAAAEVGDEPAELGRVRLREQARVWCSVAFEGEDGLVSGRRDRRQEGGQPDGEKRGAPSPRPATGPKATQLAKSWSGRTITGSPHQD